MLQQSDGGDALGLFIHRLIGDPFELVDLMLRYIPQQLPKFLTHDLAA